MQILSQKIDFFAKNQFFNEKVKFLNEISNFLSSGCDFRNLHEKCCRTVGSRASGVQFKHVSWHPEGAQKAPRRPQKAPESSQKAPEGPRRPREAPLFGGSKIGVHGVTQSALHNIIRLPAELIADYIT